MDPFVCEVTAVCDLFDLNTGTGPEYHITAAESGRPFAFGFFYRGRVYLSGDGSDAEREIRWAIVTPWIH